MFLNFALTLKLHDKVHCLFTATGYAVAAYTDQDDVFNSTNLEANYWVWTNSSDLDKEAGEPVEIKINTSKQNDIISIKLLTIIPCRQVEKLISDFFGLCAIKSLYQICCTQPRHINIYSQMAHYSYFLLSFAFGGQCEIVLLFLTAMSC